MEIRKIFYMFRDLFQAEVDLYGSSRLGVVRTTTNMQRNHSVDSITLEGDFGAAVLDSFTRGVTFLELTNHLQNVMVVVTDRKLPVADTSGDGYVSRYNADIASATDYYPGGMIEPGRDTSFGNYYTYWAPASAGAGSLAQASACAQSQYRYGFNGKEKADEIASNDYDFGARIYDPRIGKFLSVDPLAKKFSYESPYCALENSPISIIDPTGKGGIVTVDKKNCIVTVTSTFVFYGSGATADNAITEAAKIQNQWNAANGTTVIDGITYKVQFVIKPSYVDISDPQAAKALAQQIKDNKDVSVNYYRIGNDIPAGYSATDPRSVNEKPGGPGGNTGEFSSADVAGQHSTTESHEYGHALGESHVDPDDQGTLIGQGQPGIMAARGTRVDAAYTYDPKQGSSQQAVGADGKVHDSNTVDPDKRQVTQQDIDNLGLGNLQYDANGQATIGTLTSDYHPDPTTPK